MMDPEQHPVESVGGDLNAEETTSGEGDPIGARVREARQRAGLSQTALAERVGVSQPAVAAWETGAYDPRRVVIARIADVLDVSPDWLASGRRSEAERDKHAAALYLRRPLVHTPVIAMRDAARLAGDAMTGPHRFAEDYIPVTSASDAIFAVFADEPAMAGAFQLNTLAVVNYADRRPADGRYCLALIDGAARLRRWRGGDKGIAGEDAGPAFETAPQTGAPARVSARLADIIGSVIIAVRFY